MSDIEALIYRLTVQSAEKPLFDSLRDAFADSVDFWLEPVGKVDGTELYICCFRTLSSTDKLQYILGASGEGEVTAKLERFTGNEILQGDYAFCEKALCCGGAVLLSRRSSVGIVIDLSDNKHRSVDSPIAENVVHGPMNAFIESLDVNTALIRQRIRSPKLKLWETFLGTETLTRVAVFYHAEKIDPIMLNRLKDKLSQVQAESVQDSGQLIRLLLSKKKLQLFPMANSTERPDRTAASLLKGKAVIIVDGSPFAVCVPAVYTDFWHSPEDDYLNPFTAYFLLTLRFLAMFMNLFLPALYVALTSVNVDVNRLEISLAASASREGVPYPVLLETLLMLVIIDLITEASVRLPKTISSTVTMVGGVVLGQAIIQANIVSHLLVIIAAATAITNFIVIDYQMGLVQRVLKYFILAAAAVAGLLGIVFGFACLIFYLSSLESFGSPYLTSMRRRQETTEQQGTE